ncbi:MAG: HAD family acid phosphatase [Lapillicoccus sp.]
MRLSRPSLRRFTVPLTVAAVALAGAVTLSAPAQATTVAPPAAATTALAPRSSFTMKDDGSSGLTVGGAGIPNIDSVKKTIATYYNDPGTGIADKVSSPYISEMDDVLAHQASTLKSAYDAAVRRGQKPAIVFDTDDTTLMTYDMEVADMHFTFDPVEQDVWVKDERFPATPGMVDFVKLAARTGFTVFGLTGRNDDQKDATVGNLWKVGYTSFTKARFFTKWTGVGSSQQPGYITCVAVKCTTVEYKAGTRKHIEDLGYTITLNVGDQWSDLMGGYASRTLKLPNPTYYLPSTNLPGLSQPQLAPRTHFTMAPDGTSGLTAGGEGIPNIDSVKKTIAAYYGDPGTGIADKVDSPYIRELAQLVARETPRIVQACTAGTRYHTNPAVVLDADDTTLMTYDMEVADMHFTFDPVEQDVWVQDQRFPGTPSMAGLAAAAQGAGCTLVGLTGRNDTQKVATIQNLRKVGVSGFTWNNYYTKWTGLGTSQQPAYITCAAVKCTTIEYKSQTRAHIETTAGGGYDIVGNVGDQFSDLIGGHADRVVKLPNPTYYLP